MFYDKINLTSLDLSSNQITKIENIDKLNNLTSLNLSSNQIAKIEEKDLNHATLEHIELRTNLTTDIPEEILEGIRTKGKFGKTYYNNALPDLRQWFAELKEGSIPNYQFN